MSDPASPPPSATVQLFSHLLLLSDFCEFSSSDLRHNTETFLWHQRLPAVFDESRTIYRQKRAELEDALKVRHRLGYWAGRGLRMDELIYL